MLFLDMYAVYMCTMLKKIMSSEKSVISVKEKVLASSIPIVILYKYAAVSTNVQN